MISIRLIFLVSIVSSGSVYARMYQWIEADTGSTQLSGKPPVWYRSASGGPRVFVFNNGRLIDDTAIDVDEEVREQLRQRAFVLVEEDRQQAKEKIIRSQELKQKYVKEKPKKAKNAREEIVSEEEPPIELVLDEAALEDDQNEESSAEDTVNELRQMISDWEKTQTENAKKALEQ
jgi:hypothetical protein